MPKSKKGKKIFHSFTERYGPVRGAQIAYATAQKQGGKLFQELHGRPKGRKKKRG